jgi:hypothetical protein
VWEIIPNPGKIKMYTSGWPKNQNKCWYKIGSPPPVGSKNEVLKLRSVNNIVMAPAKTGKESNKRTAVIKTDHTKSGIESRLLVDDRMFMIVVIKLMAPKIDEAPARCSLKIAKSTEILEWNRFPARGG